MVRLFRSLLNGAAQDAVPMPNVAGWAVGLAFLLAGAAGAGLALLPDKVLSGWLLAFSYDSQIEQLPFLVAAARVGFALSGVLVGLHASAAVRRLWREKFLPRPPAGVAISYSLVPPGRAGPLCATLCLAAMNAPVLIALTVRPDWLTPLLREDGIFENMQAACQFLAACFMFYASYLLVRYLKPLGLVHWFGILLGLLLLFVCLEEISYGQRLLHFSTPQNWMRMNQQREFNLHNVATGLTNRLFALCAIGAGVFLPIACGLSRRAAYLMQRLRLSVPALPCVMIFAMAAVYTAPRRFKVCRIDEQDLLCYAVLAAVAALTVYCLSRPKLRRGAVPLGALLGLLVATRAITTAFSSAWPAGNFPEEAKEWFIAFGLLWYAAGQVGRGLRAKRRAGQPAGVRP